MTRFRFKGLAGIVALVLIVFALALGAGGVWLLTLGGSPYYVGAAVGLLLTAVLLLLRSRWALWIFAALLAATLVWAVFEVQLDWWPLAARLDVFFIVGVILLLPWLTRSLDAPPAATGSGDATDRSARPASIRRGGGLALALAMAAVALVCVASWFTDPHDLNGRLPPSQGAMSALGEPVRGVPPGEWHAYGRTGFGQRYSPLRPDHPGNVANLEVAWHFHTGDMRGQPGDPVETTFEVTPLKIGNRLFLCTPHQSVIALDATTGARSGATTRRSSANLALQHLTCRGLSLPAAARSRRRAAGVAALPAAVPAGADARKLFMPTADGRLIALDPDTGAVCTAIRRRHRPDRPLGQHAERAPGRLLLDLAGRWSRASS